MLKRPCGRRYSTSEIEQALEDDRQERTPFFDWSLKYLPGYFSNHDHDNPCRLHVELAADLNRITTQRGARLNYLAPRGNAKSTWATFAYPLYCACYGLERYMILSADTGIQAMKYLEAIRQELEDNESLQCDFPAVAGRGEVWRQDRLSLRNGTVIESIGTGSKLRGRKNRGERPSLILVDDPQNTGHVLSALQRERSWEWLVKDVCNAGSPITNIVVLGTALHPDAIVMKLQKTPGWRTRLYKSIIEYPKRMDLWAQWEMILHDYELGDEEREAAALAFYRQHETEMNE